jgi:Zinc dependent phospholipase C
LLLTKFPGATEEQLREAHAYAYGGSAVQDMGYYPFGKWFFSNLTHYVRSGDFVAWLLSNARTLDEYAFAIGALSHYVGDSIGHSEAINRATAVEFPKLANKFGSALPAIGETLRSTWGRIRRGGRDVGRYVTFAQEDGQAVECLHPVESIGVNGPHSVVVAPVLIRLDMLRKGVHI